MKPLERRILDLESRHVPEPTRRKMVLLSGEDPDFNQRLAEAEADGAQVIALVPLKPITPQDENHGQT